MMVKNRETATFPQSQTGNLPEKKQGGLWTMQKFLSSQKRLTYPSET